MNARHNIERNLYFRLQHWQHNWPVDLLRIMILSSNIELYDWDAGPTFQWKEFNGVERVRVYQQNVILVYPFTVSTYLFIPRNVILNSCNDYYYTQYTRLQKMFLYKIYRNIFCDFLMSHTSYLFAFTFSYSYFKLLCFPPIYLKENLKFMHDLFSPLSYINSCCNLIYLY